MYNLDHIAFLFSVGAVPITNNNVFLEKMVKCAAVNRDRCKHGRRYDEEVKLFCVYLRLTGGNKMYKTLKLNIRDGVPSSHCIDKYLARIRSNVTEGVLRQHELVDYLKCLNLPMIVSLSEDATRINGRIEYCKESNQIVGFCPPINAETGMPVPLTFAATSASAMESILTDSDANISHSVNVLMAQPLGNRIPAFCLLIYGTNGKFSAKDVTNR